MKPLNLLLFAALAFALGCGKTEAVAEGDGKKPDVDVSVTGVEDGDKPDTNAGDPGTVTTDPAKPDDKTVEDDKTTGEQKPVDSAAQASFAGKYEGKIEIPKETVDQMKQMAAQQGQPASAVDQLLASITKEKLQLELKLDGTFSMSAASQSAPGSENKGTWKLTSPDTITVTSEKLSAEARSQMKARGMTDEQINQSEKQVTQPQTLKVSNGGKTLTLTQSNMGMSMHMKFTKK